ncbi:MAG: hypothetical protein KJ077_26830 [Anaerolineae bacterium]|nr:hypothetical protein [Anaerolineae bacterium]
MAYPQCSRLLVRLAPVLLCAAAFLSLTLPILAANPGDLDSTFGNGGIVTTTIGSGFSIGHAIALQPDDKIVVAGYSSNNGRNSFALARYHDNGSLDSSFGNGGSITTSIGNDSQGEAIVIQPDKKIVVVGQISTIGPAVFKLARYNSNGSLDSGFGNNGIVTTAIGNTAHSEAILIQPDGKLVVGGSSTDGNGFTLARYNSNGSLDASFGSSGVVTTPFTSGAAGIKDIAIQPDNKIVVVGPYVPEEGWNVLALARYNSNGSLDTGFGSSGIVTTSIDIATLGGEIALQSDGKIVVTGGSGDWIQFACALLRYNDDGTLDNNFGSNGIITTSIGSNVAGADVAIQPNGKIIIVCNGTGEFALARYTITGSLDSAFGNGGVITTPIGSSAGNFVVTLQPDGKILTAGGSSGGFALARYLGEPSNLILIPPSGGTVSPAQGVTITANSGVFSQTVAITCTAQPITSTGSLSNVGLFFKLDATYLSNGLPAQPQLGQHYTIKVTYRQEDVLVGINEADLALYYWNGSTWVKEPSSVVDTSANTITASPDHFSLWAALAAPSSSPPRAYLPLILKP